MPVIEPSISDKGSSRSETTNSETSSSDPRVSVGKAEGSESDKMTPKETNMTPAEYLSSKTTLSVVKRKLPLDLNESHSKHFKLDPSPAEEDLTMSKYVSRTQNLLPDDRGKLAVELPAVNIIAGIKNMKEKLEQHERQIKQLQEQFEQRDKENKQIGAEVERSRRSRLALHTANMLTKLLEKVMKIRGIEMPKGDNDPKQSRYAQAVQLVSREKWERDTKLSIKYWRVLQELLQLTELINKTAHEDEVDFANLLLTETFFQKHEYYCWGNLFPFVYGESVEDLARRPSPLDLMSRLKLTFEEEEKREEERD